MSTMQKNRVDLRWLIRRDLPQVLRIERECFEFPWTHDDFVVCLRQRSCIGMVAECGNDIHGFMVYELHKARLHVLNLAVAPAVQRMGFGRKMVERLIDKLGQQRRRAIMLEIRERNVDGQVFFRAMGFRAVGTIQSHYDETEEDAYIMRYDLPREAPEMEMFQ